MSKVVSQWLIIPLTVALIGAIVYANPLSQLPVVQDEWKSDDPTIRAWREEMDARQQQIAERISIKEALITDLIEGRRTLYEVAQEFLKLNRETSYSMQILRSKYHHVSDEELSALNVMEFVSQRVVEQSHLAGQLCKLEEQYQELFGHPVSEAGHH